MANYTNEPPENLDDFLKKIKNFIDKFYIKPDKATLVKLLTGSSVDIVKTGNWGKTYGHAEAKATYFIDESNSGLIDRNIIASLREITSKMLQAENCGLEISELDFVPTFGNVSTTIEEELTEVIASQTLDNSSLSLSSDIIKKGKEMSEAYLYIYFVENTLREFIEHVSQNNTIIFPQEVNKTIAKNKANEAQNKFLPLRANVDLYYCDFVQLQQVIVHNWEVFKAYFPQRDQHWLRVKIEDMYRVRNLIAHCGYISTEELQMIKANFNMILKQLKV